MASLEAQDVAVRVRLVGGGAFRSEADGVSRSVRDIGKAGKEVNASAGLTGFLSRSSSLLTSTGAKLMKHGAQVRQVGAAWSMLSVPVAYAGYASVKTATQFQQAMSLLQRQANDSAKDVKYLASQINGPLATALGTTPTDLAAGLYPIVSSNVHGKRAISALSAAAMGSKVGIDSLENTSNALMAIYNTHLKGSGNFTQIMAVIDQLVGQAKAKLPDLIESMHSEVIPLAKDVGLRFQDIGSAIAAMTRMGVPMDKASTLMKLSLTKMFAPSGAGLKALQRMGLGQFQLAQDLRKRDGLLTALMDLRTHLDRLPQDERNLLLAQAFGQSRGIANIASLLNVIPAMRQIQRVADSATPRTLYQHFGQAKHTAAFKFAQLHSQLQQSMITLGNAILPVLIPFLKDLTGIVGGVVKAFKGLPVGVQHTVVKFLALFAAMGPVVYVFGSLMTVGGWLLKGFGLLGKLIGPGSALIEALPELGPALMGALGPIGLFTGAVLLAYQTITPFHNAINSIANWIGGLFGGGHKKPRDTAAHRVLNPYTGKYVLADTLPRGAGLAYSRFTRTMNLANVGDRSLGIVRNPFTGKKVLADVAHRRIPGLMTGGMVMRRGLALVGEAGPELVSLPTSARVSPLPHLSGAGTVPVMNSLAGSLAGSFEVTVNTNTYLDGELVATAVNKVNRRKANRR